MTCKVTRSVNRHARFVWCTKVGVRAIQDAATAGWEQEQTPRKRTRLTNHHAISEGFWKKKIERSTGKNSPGMRTDCQTREEEGKMVDLRAQCEKKKYPVPATMT